MTLSNGNRYLVDSSVQTLVLPAAPVDGLSIVLFDVDSSWFSSPVTVDNNGNTIMGVLDTLVLNVNGVSVELMYTTSQGWRIA